MSDRAKRVAKALSPHGDLDGLGDMARQGVCVDPFFEKGFSAPAKLEGGYVGLEWIRA